MASQRWNREDIPRAGKGARESRVPVLQEKEHSTTFMPVGSIRAMTFEPPRRLIDRGPLDNLSIALPKGPTRISRKRKLKLTQPMGRVASLDRLGEYADGGDVAYRHNGGNSEKPTVKRKKSAPTNPSQTMKTAVAMLAKTKEHEEGYKQDGRFKGHTDSASIVHLRGEDYEEQASLSTVHPKSGKLKMNRVDYSIPKEIAKQGGLFQHSPITKQSIPQEKRLSQKARSNPVIKRHWVTTEESMKPTFTSLCLTKTTLEKLAAFKHKPNSNPPNTNDPIPTLQGPTAEPQDGMVLNEQVRHEETRSSSDYGVLPGSDSSFNETLWGSKANFNRTDSDPLIAVSATAVNSNHDISTGRSGLEQAAPGDGSEELKDQREQSRIKAKDTSYISLSKLAQYSAIIEPCRYDDACYEPTSSESVAFKDLLNSHVIEMSAQESCSMHEFTVREANMPNNITEEADNIEMAHHGRTSKLQYELECLLPAHNLGQAAHNHEIPRCSFDLSHGVDNYEVEIGGVDSHVLPAQMISLPTSRNKLPGERESPETSAGRNCMMAQMERSDLDDVKIISRNLLQELWDSDDFDEGMDDDELVALVSDLPVLVPQTPAKTQQEQYKNSIYNAQVLPLSSAAGSDKDSLLPSSDHPLILKKTLEPVNGLQAILYPYIVPDPVDDYPMDDEDIEEMLKFPDLPVVKSGFPPSESVQRAFDELASGEVSMSSLQFPPTKSHASSVSPKKVSESHHTNKTRTIQQGNRTQSLPLREEDEWFPILSDESMQPATAEIMTDLSVNMQGTLILPTEPCHAGSSHSRRHSALPSCTKAICDTAWSVLDDTHEYEALNPFARPDFPALVPDRSPIVGLSAQTFLRTCFRIGEMFKEGARCDSLAQDAVIELFARVSFSSRETGSTKQHFQFADLWHDRPPYPKGLLANYKTSGLAESESKIFLSHNGVMARCLGRLKRDFKSGGWALHIITIRTTDWEEVRWTRNIVSYGQVMKEKAM